MAKKKIKNRISAILTAGAIYFLVFLLVLVLLLKPKTSFAGNYNLTLLGIEWTLIVALALIFIFVYLKKKNARK